mgnify:CR=1 FL=1
MDAPPRWIIDMKTLSILEAVFSVDEFPNVDLRIRLGADLKVSSRQIQVWFQNRRQRERRLKHGLPAPSRGRVSKGGMPVDFSPTSSPPTFPAFNYCPAISTEPAGNPGTSHTYAANCCPTAFQVMGQPLNAVGAFQQGMPVSAPAPAPADYAPALAPTPSSSASVLMADALAMETPAGIPSSWGGLAPGMTTHGSAIPTVELPTNLKRQKLSEEQKAINSWRLEGSHIQEIAPPPLGGMPHGGMPHGCVVQPGSMLQQMAPLTTSLQSNVHAQPRVHAPRSAVSQQTFGDAGSDAVSLLIRTSPTSFTNSLVSSRTTSVSSSSLAAEEHFVEPPQPHRLERLPPQELQDKQGAMAIERPLANSANSLHATLLERAVNEYGGIIQCITEPRPPYSVLSVTNGWERLCGYGRDDVIRRDLKCLQGPLTERDSIAKLMDAVSNCRSTSVHLTNYTKDGSSFEHLLFLEPLRNPAGRTQCFQATSLVVRKPGHRQSLPVGSLPFAPEAATYQLPAIAPMGKLLGGPMGPMGGLLGAPDPASDVSAAFLECARMPAAEIKTPWVPPGGAPPDGDCDILDDFLDLLNTKPPKESFGKDTFGKELHDQLA